MNKSVSATEAKKKFSALLNRVIAQRARITIKRHGNREQKVEMLVSAI